MKISVVIPVYNGVSTIIKAIESVMLNNVCTMEIIVVNDGSTDNTLEAIQEFKYKNEIDILSVYTIPNGGVAQARNYGIKKAKYEWIAFLDADDIWLKGKISLQINLIEKISPQPKFIGTARNNEVLSIMARKVVKLHKATLPELLIKIFPQTSTALVRRDSLLRVGLYDEAMTHSEDADLWVRLCYLEGEFYYHPDSTVTTGAGKHNFGATGLSANIKKMEAGACFMLKKTYHAKAISLPFYLFLLLYFKIKYVRRLLIVALRRVV